MKITELQRYKMLYKSANSMGASQIFNRYLNVNENRVVPLSVSHGVDFGNFCDPIDIYSIEPIHWSYNEQIHKESIKIKPSLLAPHPWAMNIDDKNISEGNGVLLIGPPPGKVNDQRLYELIKNDIRDNWSILVKKRGNYEPSMSFWKSKGVNPITAGGYDGDFYNRLYNVLSEYKVVVGCTFSSALIFAASINKKIEIIEDYEYRVYDVANREKLVDYNSTQAKSVVNFFLNRNQSEIKRISKELLGINLHQGKLSILSSLEDTIDSLRSAFYIQGSNNVPIKYKALLALFLKKPGLIKFNLQDAIKRIKKKEIVGIEIDEFSVWSCGPNRANYTITTAPYVKGKTEPGSAVISCS